ncbi:MAG: BBP7 family outer membrane beta-barrel protein [Planctomycetes bacterium]|nr:BBP7 family outer membrane beta-barrel protein [Planctomycetota bacterium]
MRRILLGSLALGLGMFASPAVGQDARTTPQPQRSAKLGRPLAVPDEPPRDTGITPVGLLTPRAGGDIPVPSPMPPAGGVPNGARPMNSVPMGTPMNGVPMGTPMLTNPAPTTRIIPGAPSIVEDRSNGVINPGTLGYPTGLPSTGTVIPSVGPGDILASTPGMESPLYGDCGTGIVGDPGAPIMDGAVGRVAGMGRWWVTGEYLMWWTQSANVPVLVSTSSPAFNGRLGVGDTSTVIGGGAFGQTFHSGARFSVGRWFGNDQIRGIEARGFWLGQAGSTSTVTTAMIPFLARPFNNVNPNTPFFGSDSEIVADSVRATGGVQVHLENQVWGGEINYRRNLIGNPCSACRLDALVGYRYLNMSESLSITEGFRIIPGVVAPPQMPVAAGVVMDTFRTTNQFNGGQIGLAGTWQRGRWSLDGRTAVAFGTMNRTLEIAGAQNLILANGTPAMAIGGLLALPGANTGVYHDSVFSVVPEAGLNLGYQVTSRMKVFVGYNFLYMGNVLRPGNAIDGNVDVARIPNFLPAGTATPIAGTPIPAPQIKSSGFFVQGISFGLQFNW